MINNIDDKIKPLMFHNIKEEIIYASAYIDAEGHIEFKTRLKKNGRGKNNTWENNTFRKI